MTGSKGAGRTWSSLAQISVSVLSGVGDQRAASLAEMGIVTIADLLMFYPRRHVDRTRQATITQLSPGESATLLVKVTSLKTRKIRAGRTIVEMLCGDGSGSLHVSFFNQPWRARQLSQGMDVMLFGKVETFRGRSQMTNPVVDLVGSQTGQMVPIYRQSERAGLASWEIVPLVAEAIRRAGPMADPLPLALRQRLGLVDRTEAISSIHAPLNDRVRCAALRRLAFDELLRLQVALVGRKVASEKGERGLAHIALPDRSGLVDSFLARLPFNLTSAQKSALAEIERDMTRAVPMHRLLQGDVGSGKTVVAGGAMATAVQGGHQVALMAPTEVLAEQHYSSLKDFFEGFSIPDSQRLEGKRPLKLALLTGRVPARERSKLITELAAAEVDIVVGTHALLTSDVSFNSLGLVIVDEQHRFGVEQRAGLKEKRSLARHEEPDLLVMTATPIPRTAAMTVFGDLDLTIIGEMPKGRTPISTKWARSTSEIADAWQKVRHEVEGGRRAYVICPLVEGSEKIEARSATEEFDRLSAQELNGLRLGLLHGQLPSAEKQQVMAEFRSGVIQVLVATTVIEVGVDVPDATAIVIEDAERFGMAQLHQLRGRVGRGEWESWCYLLSGTQADDASEKLNALQGSTDGFWLAEKDLELRGEGALLGTRQRGRSDLRLASVIRDADLVAMAREVAGELVGSDPKLTEHPILAEEVTHFIAEEADFLLKS